MNRTKIRAVLIAVFSFYCVMLCYFLFFADYYGRSFNLFNGGYFTALHKYVAENVNFIPFSTVALYLKGYAGGAVSGYALAVNIAGNIAAFMPFGFFLPYFFKKLRRLLPFVLVMVATVCLAEALQLIMMTGVCDIDDLILNVTGAVFAFMPTKNIFVK